MRASLEIERKYEVFSDGAPPGAEAFERIGLTATAPTTAELFARYLDTPDRALAAVGIAVRERRGGADAGWHLKERRAEEVRELHWEPNDRLPDGLRDALRGRLGGVPELELIATLSTRRTITLLARGGIPVIELADDRVQAEDEVGLARAWREWEAELLPGAARALLDAVEPVLLAAGARPSLSEAKIARASGRLLPRAIDRGDPAHRLAALATLDLADRIAARPASADGPGAAARVSALRLLAHELHGEPAPAASRSAAAGTA